MNGDLSSIFLRAGAHIRFLTVPRGPTYGAPIVRLPGRRPAGVGAAHQGDGALGQGGPRDRSEERRVGKECICRWKAYHKKRKTLVFVAHGASTTREFCDRAL